MRWFHRLFLVAAAVVAAGGAVVVDAVPAHACSCVPEGAAFNALGGADIAFVGVPTARRVEVAGDEESYIPPVVWTFDVEAVVKGEIGDTIEVRTGYGGGDCGAVFHVDERIGVLVDDGDALTTHMCGGTRDADELLATPRTMPEPTGAGPVHLLVAGRYGDAEIIALDADGRPLGYGYVPGDVRGLSVCPGSRSFVVSYGYEEMHVELWDVARLARVAELTVFDDRGELPVVDDVLSITCTSAEGDVAWLVRGRNSAPATPSRIVRLANPPADVSTVDFAGGAIGPTGRAVVVDAVGQVWVQDGDTEPELVVDLDIASDQPVVAVNPDGTVAFVAGDAVGYRVDLETGTSRRVAAVTDRVGDARWTDGGVMVDVGGDVSYVVVLDHTGAPVARIDTWGRNGTLDASGTFYVHHYGEGLLRRALDGATTAVFTESGYLEAVEAIADGPEIAPEARDRLQEPTSATATTTPPDDAVAVGTGSSGGGAGWLVALGGAGAAVVMVPLALAWTSRRRARADDAIEEG